MAGLKRSLESFCRTDDVEGLRRALEISAPALPQLSSALRVAAEFDSAQCVTLLLGRGASPDDQADGQPSAVHIAASSPNTSEALIALLDALASRGEGRAAAVVTLASPTDGGSPLHHAARIGHPKNGMALMSHGAHVKQKNASGQTAADIARDFGNREFTKLLDFQSKAGRHAWTKAERWKIFLRTGGVCYICRGQRGPPLVFANWGAEQTGPGGWRVEHVKPFSRYDLDGLENALPAHVECDMLKANQSLAIALKDKGLFDPNKPATALALGSSIHPMVAQELQKQVATTADAETAKQQRDRVIDPYAPVSNTTTRMSAKLELSERSAPLQTVRTASSSSPYDPSPNGASSEKELRPDPYGPTEQQDHRDPYALSVVPSLGVTQSSVVPKCRQDPYLPTADSPKHNKQDRRDPYAPNPLVKPLPDEQHEAVESGRNSRTVASRTERRDPYGPSLGLAPVVDRKQQNAVASWDGNILTESDVLASDLKCETLMKTQTRIGHGMFGDVFRVQVADNGLAALKVFDPDEASSAQAQAELATCRLLQHTPHPHVVAVLGMCEHPDHLGVLFELCDFPLSQVLENRVQFQISATDRLCWGSDIAQGLAFFHTSLLLRHGDVKPENVLLVSRRENQRPHTPTSIRWEAKICDFGCSVSASDSEISGGIEGTPAFLAPELWDMTLKGHSSQVGSAADIYAYGLTLWCVATRCSHPWSDYNHVGFIFRTVQQGGRPTVPALTEYWLGSLVERCWKQHAPERPTALEVCDVIARAWGSISEA